MSILVLILALISLSTNKRDVRRSDAFRWIAGAFAGLFVLSLIADSPLFSLATVGYIIYRLAKKGKITSSSSTAEQNRSQYTPRRQQDYNGNARETTRVRTAGNRATREQINREVNSKSSILPMPATRRTKIVRNFNDKYELKLTDQEINRIVEASYVSEAWKQEVEAMAAKYDRTSQWYVNGHDWLRVYMYAFHVQNISSDFAMQEQICFETLDEIMAYAASLPAESIDARVEAVNNRYFTRFDEMTFMIAYRFLQSKGRNYTLKKPDLVKNVDMELEETMKKYQQGGLGV